MSRKNGGQRQLAGESLNGVRKQGGNLLNNQRCKVQKINKNPLINQMTWGGEIMDKLWDLLKLLLSRKKQPEITVMIQIVIIRK